MQPNRKLGADLVVGDVLDMMSGPRTITHFEAHPGLHVDGVSYSARVAHSGSWSITIFDDDRTLIVPLMRQGRTIPQTLKGG